MFNARMPAVPVLLCHPPGLSGLPRGQRSAQEHPSPRSQWPPGPEGGEFGTEQRGFCADGDMGGVIVAF